MVKDCKLLPAKRSSQFKSNKATPEDVDFERAKAETEESCELKANGPVVTSKLDRAEAHKQWKKFKPRMEGPLFYAEALLNDVRFVKALVDSGSASYATISEKVAKELKLPKIPI